VVLAGMQAPRNLGKDYTLEFDAIYPRLAEQYDISLYPFFLDGVALDPALNQPDGIHPNPAGVKVIVKKILPLLESELQKLNPEN
jgi:acyl-CoA thioesterase-1